jgi:antitoxin ParD1/3/4
MAETEKISIDLTPEVAAELRQAVDRGEYGSVGEIVTEAVTEWRARRKADIEELRRLVQEGVDSGPDIDAEEVFARLRAKFGRHAAE